MFWILLGALAIACAATTALTFIIWTSKIAESDHPLAIALMIGSFLIGPVIGVCSLIVISPYLQLDTVHQILLVVPAIFIPFFVGVGVAELALRKKASSFARF